MNSYHKRRVFEPFFTTRSKVGGTGLGLSISYFIITDNHNGKIEVISQIDNGTTFIIWLPTKEQSEIGEPD